MAPRDSMPAGWEHLHRAEHNVQSAARAAGLAAIVHGLLLRLARVGRCARAFEVSVRRKRTALLVESRPEHARFAALLAEGHRLTLRAGAIALALRPSRAHIRRAVGNRAPGDSL